MLSKPSFFVFAEKCDKRHKTYIQKFKDVHYYFSNHTHTSTNTQSCNYDVITYEGRGDLRKQLE